MKNIYIYIVTVGFKFMKQRKKISRGQFNQKKKKKGGSRGQHQKKVGDQIQEKKIISENCRDE